jgi:pyroglutamyl-peptidase
MSYAAIEPAQGGNGDTVVERERRNVRTTVLVTAFGPFPGVPNNPSAALAETLRSSSKPFHRTTVLLLPTSYQRAFANIAANSSEAAAIVLVGYAAGTVGLRLEQAAYNEATATIPDVDGRSMVGVLDEQGPYSVRTSADVIKLAAAAESVGCPTVRSMDPGRYVCNATYYKTLLRNAEWGLPVILIHVGDWALTAFDGERVEAGLKAVIASLAGGRPSGT